MKVGELIEKLKELDQDRDIMFECEGYYSEYDGYPFTDIDEIIKEDLMGKKVYVIK